MRVANIRISTRRIELRVYNDSKLDDKAEMSKKLKSVLRTRCD